MTPSMADRSLWGGDVPWVTPKDMKRHRIKDAIDHVSRKALEVTSLSLLPAPAVLLVVRGMILARTVPIAVTDGPVAVNQDMKALLPAPDVDADFLALTLLAARDALATMIDDAGHGTKRLPMERWRNLPVPVPPRAEQKRTVAVVSQAAAELDQATVEVMREIGLLRELHTRLIADVVTGRVDIRETAASLPTGVDDVDTPVLDEDIDDGVPDEVIDESSADEADA
jgi:type I restriction enzyme S subunit